MVYLAAAFIVLWLAVTLFVAYMLIRQRRLEQEIDVLEELVEARRQAAQENTGRSRS